MEMDLFLIMLYFCVAASIGANDDHKLEISTVSSNGTQCKLPPRPEHGSYTSSPEASPGDSLDTFQLNVTCDQKYKLTGLGMVGCSQVFGCSRCLHVNKGCLFCCESLRVCKFASQFFHNCILASGEEFKPLTDESKSEKNTTESCVLPPTPKQGSYTSAPIGSPGQTLESFELTVTCDQGFELVGASNITCSSGRMSQSMPECLASCASAGDNGADILNCDKMGTNITASTTEQTTSETNVDIRNLELCVLPPYPEHGRYRSYPGIKVNTFQLNVTCNYGYHLVGEENVKCIYGMMGQMPVCLPYCKVGEQSTVTCENVQRCVLTSTDEILLSSRVAPDTECGTVGLSRRRRLPVSGGYVAKIDEVPWHTGIYRKSPPPFEQICGGTLIAKRVVISAAHCFTDGREIPSASNYALAAGKIYRSWKNTADSHAQRNYVKEIKIPPRYQGPIANYQEDIAVLISVEEFSFEDFVRPACLSFDPKFDEDQLVEGTLGKIAGWGLTNEFSSPSLKLRVAQLPYISIEKCIEKSPPTFRGSITADKICAGYENGTSACRGDSGGGLVFLAQEEHVDRYFLRGVISTSPVNNMDCNIYTWVTFTHVQRHATFIKTAARGLL